jgi:hypothetical protein
MATTLLGEVRTAFDTGERMSALLLRPPMIACGYMPFLWFADAIRDGLTFYSTP